MAGGGLGSHRSATGLSSSLLLVLSSELEKEVYGWRWSFKRRPGGGRWWRWWRIGLLNVLVFRERKDVFEERKEGSCGGEEEDRIVAATL